MFPDVLFYPRLPSPILEKRKYNNQKNNIEMAKKLLSMTLGLALAISASANINFSSADVQYWVGTGTNQAVVVIGWDDNPNGNFALAWGVRWNGSATAANMLDTIATYDSRMTYNIGSGFVTSIVYNDGTLVSGSTASYWCYYVNGSFADAYGVQAMTDGDLMEISSSCTFSLTSASAVTDPAGSGTPAEATIAASDILYWVGTGSDEAILAINWADTALAWGYRYSGTATVADMMSAVAAADPRLTVVGSGFVSDILYIDTAAGMSDTLRITAGNYWESTNNGYSDMGMGQTLADGDLEKWADPAAGIVVDSASYEYGGVTYWYYINVYPMTITPVSVPDTTNQGGPVEPEHGPFCGAVGTEGCDAIAADASIIVAWATGCSVERGPVDISDPDGPRVHYGTDAMGTGPAGTSTTNAVSLGDGGTATLTFALPIADGVGPDFAVFENSFNDAFLELAYVEVSSDGERYVRFPATSLTPTDVQVGPSGSVDPTYINNLAGKYRVGYGTPFDLAELADSTGLDINNVRYVRLVDVVGSIDPQYGTRDAHGNLVNDPWPTNDTVYGSGGFDLTGVAVINQNTNGINTAESASVSVYPNPTADMLNISAAEAAEATLMDACGRTVATIVLKAGNNTVDMALLPAGIYMLKVANSVSKIVKM